MVCADSATRPALLATLCVVVFISLMADAICSISPCCERIVALASAEMDATSSAAVVSSAVESVASLITP